MPSWQKTQDTPEENDQCALYWCGELGLIAANVSTNFERVDHE